MKAIILAAGRGSRMKEFTDNRPKCLVEFKGKALLHWQLQALSAAGIDEIAIVTGYQHDLLNNLGLKEFHNKRWAETNMVSSLEFADEWLRNFECIVSYSDIFYDKSAVQSLMVCKKLLSLTYDPNWLNLWTKRFGDPLLDAETFRISKTHLLTEIGNKPLSTYEIQGQYMGLVKLTPKSWLEIVRIRKELCSDIRDQMHMTGLLQRIIDASRIPISAIPYNGVWGEVDSMDDLKAYSDD